MIVQNQTHCNFHVVNLDDLVHLESWAKSFFKEPSYKLFLNFSATEWHDSLTKANISRNSLTVGFRNFVRYRECIQQTAFCFPIHKNTFIKLCKKGIIENKRCHPKIAFKEFVFNIQNNSHDWTNRLIPKTGKYLKKISQLPISHPSNFHIFKKIYLYFMQEGLL